MIQEKTSIIEAMRQRGVSRRQFVQFCGMMAAVLSLPPTAGRVIANALASTQRLPVIWLEFQDCTGDTESFLRACRRTDAAVQGKEDPSLTELVLDILSIDYHETLMAAAGFQAEKSRSDVISQFPKGYLCVVEGSIPTAMNGYFCTIGGRTAMSIARETCSQALATVAFGTCAWEGGLPAAGINPTGAKGVRDVVPGLTNLVNIPGCPANVVNLVATIVHFLTYNKLPNLDRKGRPLFAYGTSVHDQCERKDNGIDEAQSYSDTLYRNGGCLKELGCRGPETYSNCPTVRWNDGACWPVAAGHGCIGCTSEDFWDQGSFHSYE